MFGSCGGRIFIGHMLMIVLVVDPPPGWPLWRTTYLCTTLLMRMLSKWPWISCCGDYWQQAELRTDGARQIMMNDDMLFLSFSQQH